MKLFSSTFLAICCVAILGYVAFQNDFVVLKVAPTPPDFQAVDELIQQGDDFAASQRLLSYIEEAQGDPAITKSCRWKLVGLYCQAEQYDSAAEQLTMLFHQTDDQMEQIELLNARAAVYESAGADELAATDRDLASFFSERIARNETEPSPWQAPSIRTRIDRAILGVIPQAQNNLWIRILAFTGCGVAFLLALVPFNIWMGNRQRREAEGTWNRLFWVSCVIAFLQSLPVILCLVLLAVVPQTTSLEGVITVTPLVFLFVLFWNSLVLLPPTRWIGSGEGLPRISDESFLSRLQGMCQKLGLPVPVTREWPSSGGGMILQAFAGGVVQPSLTISDGIMMRLEEPEADAIVAHELGHIANHSLWFYPATFSLAWSSAVIAAMWMSPWAAMLFGFAMQTGLSRIVSRYFEYDSDRIAASVAGYKTTVSALDKIHLASQVSNTGWNSFLAFSVATHPSQDERLQALADIAPENDQPAVQWSTKSARRRRTGARVAFACWSASMILAATLSYYFYDALAIAILLGISLTPSTLLQRAVRKEVRTELKRRQFQPGKKIQWPVILIVVIVMLALFYFLDQAQGEALDWAWGEMIWILFGLPFGIAVLLFAWGIWQTSRSPQAKIRLAIHQRRWQDAVDLGKLNAKKIKNDATLRHDLTLALWMSGQQHEAIESMRELREEYPEFKHPWLIESLMHLERDEVDEASQLIEEVRLELKDDISVNGIAARIDRIRGELDNMLKEAAEIEKIVPDSAGVQAFRCAVEMDRGNLDKASEYWEAADHLAPGDAYITLLKAELACLNGNEDEAIASLSAAKRLIDATPFAFLGAELRHTQNRVLGSPESLTATEDEHSVATEFTTENPESQ